MSRPPGDIHPRLWPKAASPSALTGRAAERAISKIIEQLSVEEKVAQTIQADIGSFKPEDFAKFPLGAVLAGGSSAPRGDARAKPDEWLALARSYREAARRYWGERPVLAPLFGVDAVHGHQKVIGATIFPHNIGLGAARDPDLAERIAGATAAEVAATGIDWTFAPSLAVPRNYRWGRVYEGFSENPQLVAAYAGPAVRGLQGELHSGAPLAAGRIVATAKHFLGDGATQNGQDQGDVKLGERELAKIHAAAYAPSIEAGVLTIMASFTSWNGRKMIADRGLLTGVLKERMGFKGLVLGDWNAHGQVPGCTNESCPDAMKAGLDMYMAPDSWRGLYANTLAQVSAGVIPMARLDDAVRRILRVKMKAGLFADEHPFEGRFDLIGAPAHRALAREAVRKSLVLLKNDGVLPIPAKAHVLVAGDGANSIAKQSGGWSLTWQGRGTSNADFPNGQSIFAGLRTALRKGGGNAVLSRDGRFKKRPDAAVVVFGEDPYAEFHGDRASLHFSPGDDRNLALMRRLKEQQIPVAAIFLSGRPLWVNREINAAGAFIAAFLPGSEGGGVADLIIGDAEGRHRFDFTGRLGFSWPGRPDGAVSEPPLFPLGYGLSYQSPGRVGPLSEDAGDLALASRDIVFSDGCAEPQLRLILRDEGGERDAAEDAAESPRGILSLGSFDGEARKLRWSGRGPATLAFEGAPRSLARHAQARMALAMRIRLDEAPARPVELGMASDDDTLGMIDVTGLLRELPAGSWQTLKIPLGCFADAGANLVRIAEPVLLKTEGRLAFSLAEIRFAKSDKAMRCPSP